MIIQKKLLILKLTLQYQKQSLKEKKTNPRLLPKQHERNLKAYLGGHRFKILSYNW